MTPLISIQDFPLKASTPSISWDIFLKQLWLVQGNFNSGRSELLKMITAQSFHQDNYLCHYFENEPQFGAFSLSPHLIHLNFRGLMSNHQDYYYQQRYHATQVDTIQTLKQMLYTEHVSDTTELTRLVQKFDLENSLYKEIIKLSSGEYRKASIIKTVLMNPKVILMEEPYCGLDRASMNKLDEVLEYIQSKDILVIIASNLNHFPKVATHILTLDHGTIFFKGPIEHYNPKTSTTSKYPTLNTLLSNNYNNYENAFQFVNTKVQYYQNIIFEQINWKVPKGSRWILSGPNGAGKSTLLSLIFGDHPQAYANEIYIFDRRRGTGETIWEIKERIGYFSSELFLYTQKTEPVESYAFQYLNTNPYKKLKKSDQEQQAYEELVEFFKVGNFTNQPFYKVPNEVQRIFMLMNVFLSNRPLMIFDEPYHGLDTDVVEKFNYLIEHLDPSKTIIFVSHNPDQIPKSFDQKFSLI